MTDQLFYYYYHRFITYSRMALIYSKNFKNFRIIADRNVDEGKMSLLDPTAQFILRNCNNKYQKIIDEDC